MALGWRKLFLPLVLLFCLFGSVEAAPGGQGERLRAWIPVGLPEACLVLALCAGVSAQSLRQRAPAVVWLGLLSIPNETFLKPFLAEGGSLQGGFDGYLDWLADNYFILRAALREESLLLRESETEATYGRRWED